MDTRIPLLTSYSFVSDEYREMTDPFEGHGISCRVPVPYRADQLTSEILGCRPVSRSPYQVMIMEHKDRMPLAWVAPGRDPESGEWDDGIGPGEALRIRANVTGHKPDPEWGKSTEEQWYDSAVRQLQDGGELDLTEVNSVLRWMTRPRSE